MNFLSDISHYIGKPVVVTSIKEMVVYIIISISLLSFCYRKVFITSNKNNEPLLLLYIIGMISGILIELDVLLYINLIHSFINILGMVLYVFLTMVSVAYCTEKKIFFQKKNVVDDILDNDSFLINLEDFKTIFGTLKKVKLFFNENGYYVDPTTYVISSKANKEHNEKFRDIGYKLSFTSLNGNNIKISKTNDAIIYSHNDNKSNILIVINNHLFRPYPKDEKRIIKVYKEMLKYLIYKEECERLSRRQDMVNSRINKSNEIVKDVISSTINEIVDGAEQKLIISDIQNINEVPSYQIGATILQKKKR